MIKTIAAVTVLQCLLALAAPADGLHADLMAARDKQDLAALDQIIASDQKTAQQSAEGEYQLALAQSYAAEVAMEMRDKRKSERYAEAGIEAAQKAVAQNGNNAEYHRLYGELCGQVIPANPLMGALKYGQCAKDEIDKALSLDSKLALAYVSRGVGNYYLPASMGGGTDVSLKDFDKAIALNPKLDDAYLWKGITLRKANRNGEARQALMEAVKLDPNRVWAKQQLEKTPEK
jgi:tetratricopeptide (TPR) repeat protein